MSVPPPNQSNNPSTRVSDDSQDQGPEKRRRTRNDKEFRLPDRREKKGENPDKGLFGLTQNQEVKGTLGEATAIGAAGKTEGLAGASQVSKIAALIQGMVSSMRIGAVGGKDFASLTLSKGVEVPEAFAGSHLSINFVENSLVIRFDAFDTPQQQQQAILLVEQNRTQLTDLMQSMLSKNMQISEFMIGTHVVQLPRIQPLPPPFQASQISQAESQLQREKGQDQQHESPEEK